MAKKKSTIDPDETYNLLIHWDHVKMTPSKMPPQRPDKRVRLVLTERQMRLLLDLLRIHDEEGAVEIETVPHPWGGSSGAIFKARAAAAPSTRRKKTAPSPAVKGGTGDKEG